VVSAQGVEAVTLLLERVTANRIGHVAPDGTIAEYDLPTPGSEPHGITIGPDGAVWAALEARGVARLGPAVTGHRSGGPSDLHA
jgi:streptogramin lyase